MPTPKPRTSKVKCQRVLSVGAGPGAVGTEARGPCLKAAAAPHTHCMWPGRDEDQVTRAPDVPRKQNQNSEVKAASCVPHWGRATSAPNFLPSAPSLGPWSPVKRPLALRSPLSPRCSVRGKWSPSPDSAGHEGRMPARGPRLGTRAARPAPPCRCQGRIQAEPGTSCDGGCLKTPGAPRWPQL